MSPAKITGIGPNPSGLCRCGCGQRTRIAPYSSRRTGWIMGKPIPYIAGHATRGRITISFTVNPVTGCWDWQGPMSQDGYGLCSLHGKQHNAHRAVWIIMRGSIDGGLVLDHRCQNRRCVNPDHMEPVTHAENSRRSSKVTRLDVETVREIKRALESDTIANVARAFGVDHRRVQKIKAGTAWRGV